MTLSLLLPILVSSTWHRSEPPEFPAGIYSAPEIASRLSDSERTIRCDSQLTERASFLSLAKHSWDDLQSTLRAGLGFEIAKEDGKNRFVLQEAKDVKAERLEMQMRLSRLLLKDLLRAWEDGVTSQLGTPDTIASWQRFRQDRSEINFRKLQECITGVGAALTAGASPQTRSFVTRTLRRRGVPNLVTSSSIFFTEPLGDLILPELEGKAPCSEIGFFVELSHNRQTVSVRMEVFGIGKGRTEPPVKVGYTFLFYELSLNREAGPEDYFLGAYPEGKPELSPLGKVAASRFASHKAMAKTYWSTAAGTEINQFLRQNRARTLVSLLSDFSKENPAAEIILPLEGPSTVDLDQRDAVLYDYPKENPVVPRFIGRQGEAISSWLPFLTDTGVTAFRNPLGWIDTDRCPPIASALSILKLDPGFDRSEVTFDIPTSLRYYSKTTNRRRNWVTGNPLFTRLMNVERGRAALTYAAKLIDPKILTGTTNHWLTVPGSNIEREFLGEQLTKHVTSTPDMFDYFNYQSYGSTFRFRILNHEKKVEVEATLILGQDWPIIGGFRTSGYRYSYPQE